MIGPVVGYDLNKAAQIVHAGGVIAYPPAYCFGLGCDPRQSHAVRRVLAIKHRDRHQGVLLVASHYRQLLTYVDLRAAQSLMRRYWPGPVSLIIPARTGVSAWIRGHHAGVGCRISAHPVVRALCNAVDMALVSTSANRHGSQPLRATRHVVDVFGHQLDYIVDARVGSARAPSRIIDVVSGRTVR